MIDQRLVATILEPDVERRLGAGASRAVRRVRDLEERVVEQGLNSETTLSLGPRSLFFVRFGKIPQIFRFLFEGKILT